jgi:MoxR-like ATPase
MSSLQDIYRSILLPGREEEAKILILALISKQHAVLIGPPGTGKSLLIKNLARGFQVDYFEYLLTKFTMPEEILGVPNIKKLREDGQYQVMTKAKLPEAKLAFVDEVFKGSSAILNSLLSILNEREFYDGITVKHVPLWTCLGASNEVPVEEELKALWDRLVFRQWVDNLPKDKWDSYLSEYWAIHQAGYAKSRPSFDFSVIENANQLVYKVDVFTVKSKLLEILARLEDSHSVVTSDRRKGRCLIALAANAVLNGRQAVIPEDLLVLKYVIPEREENVKIVEQTIIDIAGKTIKAKQQLAELIPQVEGMLGDLQRSNNFNEAMKIAEDVKPIRAKITDLESVIPDSAELQRIKELLEIFNEALVEKMRV